MYQQVLRFAPNNWDLTSNDLQNFVGQYTEEYNQVSFEIRQAVKNVSVSKLLRIQNVHDFGQLLLREQYLATTFQNEQYFRVRKYMVLKKMFLDDALTYNLDPRRCGLEHLAFHSHITSLNQDDVLIVVKVLTDHPYSDVIKPELSTEYYIEYVAEVTRR